NKRLDNLTHEGIYAISDINEDWNLVKTQIVATADSTLGIQKKERVKEWFDEECEQITKEKNEEYLCMLQRSSTKGSTEEYKKRRREEKKIHRRKKDYMRQNWLKK
ncbi:hypothetical protein C0J52_21054, partial [Blattella germanica]